MREKVYYITVSTLFSILAIVHVFRIVNDWGIIIGGAVIPMWASWTAAVIAGFLALSGFTFISEGKRK